MSPLDINEQPDKSRPFLRVQLQVAGLHCPSCVEHINRLLSTLEIDVTLDNISVSYLDHTVFFHLALFESDSKGSTVIEDNPAIRGALAKTVKSLQDDGFQTNAIECKIIRDDSLGKQEHQTKTFASFDLQERDQVINYDTQREIKKSISLWNRLLHPQKTARLQEAERQRERQWQRHLQVCRICRQGDSESKEVIDQQMISSSSKTSTMKQSKEKTWKATYTVGGMTCASCVSNVEKVVGSMEINLQSFGVALMQGSATAILVSNDGKEAEKRAMAIQEAIDDAGYDCQLEEVRIQDQGQVTPTVQRTVPLRVEGMFCSHCVSKIKQYLNNNPSIDVKEQVLAGLGLSNPIIAVTYTPSQSNNIRTIVDDINKLDPAFYTQLVTTPSISSRSAQQAQKELHSLIIRLVFAFLFVPPTLLIAVIVPTFLSHSHPLRVSLSKPLVGQANKGDFILWALSTPVQFGVGYIFYQRAYKSLRSVWRNGRCWSDRLISWGDMNVLVALGTSVAYFASLAFLIVDTTRQSLPDSTEGSMTYFDACVFLIFFILFGRVLESWSKRKTSSAVSALGSLRPSQGLLLQDPEALTSSPVDSLDVELLEIGDLVLIPSGSSPPLDSTFVSTSNNPKAAFLESAISGESKSVIKINGDQLYAGTVNQSKTAIIARVNALAGSNLIDNVIEIVQSSSSKKAEIEQLADKVTSHFVPLIVTLALIVLIIWIAILYSPGIVSDQWKQDHIQNHQQSGSQILYALQFAVSVLVVACPCGIGLAAPTAQITAIGLASKHGILVQGGGQAFQTAVRLSKTKTQKAFVFDKTGTITHGNDGIVQEAFLEDLPYGLAKETLWKAVWLMEGNSGHPVAIGIRKWCESRSSNTSKLDLEDVEEVAGRGLKARATLDGSKCTILVGNLSLINEDNAMESPSSQMQDTISKWQRAGASVVFVAIQGEDGHSNIVAALAIADTIRKEAAKTIEYLKKRYQGNVWMVSGDTVNTARAIASQVGIDESNVIAGVLPTEKAEWVERIKNKSSEDLEINSSSSKQLVAFIGDGINDAPALSTANLSIALGSGSSLATSTASFILLNTETPLASIPTILSLSKATEMKIWQNLTWACAFNVIFIPIAAGAFVEKNFTFGPSWSGLAMALSSVSVVLNALTLRFWTPPKMA